MTRTFRDYARNFVENLDARKAYRWASGLCAGLALGLAVDVTFQSDYNQKPTENIQTEDQKYENIAIRLRKNVEQTGIPITFKEKIFPNISLLSFLERDAISWCEKKYVVEDMPKFDGYRPHGSVDGGMINVAVHFHGQLMNFSDSQNKYIIVIDEDGNGRLTDNEKQSGCAYEQTTENLRRVLDQLAEQLDD